MEATSPKRIAHLSDIHLLEPAGGRARKPRDYDIRTRFLSVGRPLDEAARKQKLARALRRARTRGASHVVLSGDLTEMGTPRQFESLAEVLSDSGIDDDAFTLVPGNHDLYTSPHAWNDAISGPLRRWSRSSAHGKADVIDIGVAKVLPIDVTIHQAVTRSAGELSQDTSAFMERRATDPAFANTPLLVVQHHQPFPHGACFMQWIDGLQGVGRIMSLLERVRTLHVLHGHLHRIVSRAVGIGHPRILGAPAIVDDTDDEPRVRLYEAREGRLESVGFA